jgi:hypothetical protein
MGGLMADETVDIDSASMREVLYAVNGEPDVIAAKLELANKAAEYAKSIAPVETGTYRTVFRSVRAARPCG